MFVPFFLGVIRQGEGRYAYGNYKCDQVIAVNLTSNRSAVGVGRLARSSEDLLTARNSGICVKMLHVFGDKLWNIEPSQVFQMPNAGATIKAPTMEEFPSLGESMIKSKKDAPKNNQSPFKIENDNIDNDDDDRNQFDDESDIISEIDKLDLTEGKPIDEKMIAIEIQDKKLKEAFLKALKKFGKQPPTQLLTSNFYRCHMLEADNSIDIKHSSYKKLSKFLSEMATDNFLTVKEETKGVEKITAFNVSHPDVVNYILKIDDIEASTLTTASGTGGNNLFVTEMKELYFVTESTMKFFNLYDIKCGEGIEPAQVKKFVKDYVCNNKLQDSINIRIIHVDDMIEELCDLEVDTKKIAFDDLLSSVYDKMKHSYAMRNKNELKTSGKTSTIKMTLATRSGNKKVTLIDHLEMFGIKLPEFAQACKIGVAASTSIYRPECPGNSNKGQLLVQGNQIRFVHKLLTDKYKIPPKYITGLDLAKKDKKPKKK